MVTEATEIGYGPIPGMDPNKSYYHYKLAPGIAYLVDDHTGTRGEVKISQADADAAKPTHVLRFVNGRTVIVFILRDKQVAQTLPLPKDPPKREAKPRGRMGTFVFGKGKHRKPGDRKPQEAPRAAAPRRSGSYEPL